MATQADQVQAMIAQLRTLDPSAAANPGSPERLLIEVMAQASTDNGVDLTVLSQSLGLDSKFGANVDNFLGLFRFGRQQARFSTGFVTYSRTTPAAADIKISAGNRVKTPPGFSSGGVSGATENVFATTFAATLAVGTTSVQVPVRAVTAGASGDVPASSITVMVGTPVPGVTAVTNEVPTSGGQNAESDEEYKTRFKNTYLRNLSGTADQFLALAVSTNYTTKANVVGPVSRYREYVQVPNVDDATSDPPYGSGGGSPGEYTTALSTIPYADHVWVEIPYFVSNGAEGDQAVFYRAETDFVLNLGDDRDRGDAHRLRVAGEGDDPADFPTRPNVTFSNVYTGADDTVSALRPGDVVLLEFSYLSVDSRNDFDRLVSNAVDVYVDSSNDVSASAIIPRPVAASSIFVNDPTGRNHYENYRRVGEPEHRPIVGDLLSPMFSEPVVQVPDVIVVEGAVTTTYYKDAHYWAVEDVSELGGTIRARSGIEWSMVVRGQVDSDPDDGPYTGAFVSEHGSGVAIPVLGYTYDRNIADLQAAFEGSKQITTDALAHRGRTRFFKLDVTIMYTPGYSAVDVNANVRQAVQAFLRSLYFGTVVQLSDLLQVIHNVDGVDNVRWSSDTPGFADLNRLVETNDAGEPLTAAVLDPIQLGDGSTTPSWLFYFTGSPTGGAIVVRGTGLSSTSIEYDYDAAAAQVVVRLLPGLASATVTGSGTPADPFVISAGAPGAYSLTLGQNLLTGEERIVNSDFTIFDDELVDLPSGQVDGDTLAGLVIRAKAQSTWNKR